MRKNILFCYSRLPSFTNTVRDYVLAFGDYSSHRIHYFDMDSGPLSFDLEPFDCLIFNYCFWARGLTIPSDLRKRIANFSGLKIVIFQDEYDYFLWHKKTIISLGINTIITCVPEAHWPDVYSDKAFRETTFINALTGYVSDNLLSLPKPKPLQDRDWVLGYRGRPIPFTYGRLTQEKQFIGERMKQICSERGIPANIEMAEELRIYGASWPEFLGNCRAVLGTESGSNFFDFDGSIKPAIEAFLKEKPDADFESVHERFLKEHDGKIKMNQISPRIFESIVMRTGLVLFEGEYSGVVRPWDHFIPLKKDFSNVDDVFTILADLDRLQAMTQRAYDDVIASGRYHFRTFINAIDSHISNSALGNKGYEPYYELIAWRASSHGKLKKIAHELLAPPTNSPLQYFDEIQQARRTLIRETNFLVIKINWSFLHRKVMRHYESLLYSPVGRQIQKYLKRNEVLYSMLRKCIHLVTFRR